MIETPNYFEQINYQKKNNNKQTWNAFRWKRPDPVSRLTAKSKICDVICFVFPHVTIDTGDSDVGFMTNDDVNITCSILVANVCISP